MDRLPPSGRVLVVEMSMGQMIDDVKLAAAGSRKIEFFGRTGGLVPSPDEVGAEISRLAEAAGVTAA